MRVGSTVMSGSDEALDRQRSSSAIGDKKEVSRFKRRLLTSRALFFIWAPLAVILVWQVISKSVAAYLADSRPDVAIQLRSTNPTALMNLAGAALERAQTKSKSSPSPKIDPAAEAQIRSWAELALRNDPLNARALRILGQLSQGNTDDNRTDTLMRAAARRSLHESNALYWMMFQSYQRRDYSAAIYYADALMRTRSGASPQVVPILGKIAENADASGELKKLLAGNPPWRSEFFSALLTSISDARTPLDIFLALKNTPNPGTAEEIRAYLQFLIKHRFYDLAYYAWLQFLPMEQLSQIGRIVNGDFESPSSGMPFDWQFTETPGAAIEVTARPAGEGGGHALFIKFGTGRVDFGGVSQLINLPPGSYEFRGKQKADLVSKMGLRWYITCAGTPDNRIGESPLVNGRDLKWKDFAFPLTVSETDCSAQYVGLASEARSASEQFISGSIWIDDLQIVRKPADGS